MSEETSAIDYVELLASKTHQIWAHWMRYFLEKFPPVKARKNYLISVPAEDLERWLRQMETDYADLPEEEKKSDYRVGITYLKDLLENSDKFNWKHPFWTEHRALVKKVQSGMVVLRVPDRPDCSIGEITYFDGELGIWIRQCTAAIGGVRICRGEHDPEIMKQLGIRSVYLWAKKCPLCGGTKQEYWDIWR